MRQINVEVENANIPAGELKTMRELTEEMAVTSAKADEAIEAVQVVSTFTERIENLESKAVEPDYEDITKNGNSELKFAEKDYDSEKFSGLGRKYLRKNLRYVDYDTILRFDGFVENAHISQTTRRVPTFYYFDTIRKSFLGAELVNGNLTYYALIMNPGGLDPNPGYTTPDSNNGYVYDGKLYSYSSSDGLTEVEGQQKNVLTQEMINDENTIYHIQYDYDLQGETINIPDDCVLLFEGGSICNGSIVGANTSIISATTRMPFVDIEQSGTFITYANSDKVLEIEHTLDDLSLSKANSDEVYTKSEVDDLLEEKAEVSAVYSKEDTNALLNNKADITQVESALTDIDHSIDDLSTGKADSTVVTALSENLEDNYYTKEQVDTSLGEKADETDLNNLSENLQDNYYDKDTVDTLLDDKANTEDLPDMSVYYNKQEVNGLFRNSGKTEQRPTVTMDDAGLTFFDEDLGKTIAVKPYNNSAALPFDGFISGVELVETPYNVHTPQGIFFSTDVGKFCFKHVSTIEPYTIIYTKNQMNEDYSPYRNPSENSLFSFAGRVYIYNSGESTESIAELTETTANAVKFADSNGFTAAITRGTSEDREALINNNVLSINDIGYGFYDTTLKVQCYLAVYNGEMEWLTDKGFTPALVKGRTEQRPVNLRSEFDIGYEYFDTTLGEPVYWTGSRWVDCNGFTPLPKTSTTSTLGTTHANANARDIGMDVLLTNVNKMAYLTSFAYTDHAMHVWRYADGSIALDERGIVPPVNDNPLT